MSSKTNATVAGVKIGVRRRGCSGLTYTMNYCNSLIENKFDEIISDKGIASILLAFKHLNLPLFHRSHYCY